MKIQPRLCSLPLPTKPSEKTMEGSYYKNLLTFCYIPLIAGGTIYAIVQLKLFFPTFLNSNHEWFNKTNFNTSTQISDTIRGQVLPPPPSPHNLNATSTPLVNSSHVSPTPDLKQNPNKNHGDSSSAKNSLEVSYWDYLNKKPHLYYTVPLSALVVYFIPFLLKKNIFEVFKSIISTPATSTVDNNTPDLEDNLFTSLPISPEWLKNMLPFVKKPGVNEYV